MNGSLVFQVDFDVSVLAAMINIHTHYCIDISNHKKYYGIFFLLFLGSSSAASKIL